MRIAIASDDRKTISGHFGRAAGFSVFDLDGEMITNRGYRENIGKNKGECGTCDHAAMIKNIEDCQVVISHGMGRRIYDDLSDKGISAVVTDEESVAAALEKFKKDALENRLDRLH